MSAENSLQFGNAEVCQDRRPYCVPLGKALVKDDVSGFDVTMDHAFLMSIVNGEADRCEDVNDVGGGWKLSLARCVTEIVSECRSFDIVHHHIGCGSVRVRGMDELKVVNLHDIGVVQRRNKSCFALETRGEIGIGLQIGVELLNGNRSVLVEYQKPSRLRPAHHVPGVLAVRICQGGVAPCSFLLLSYVACLSPCP